jgi:hypothetical protein
MTAWGSGGAWGGMLISNVITAWATLRLLEGRPFSSRTINALNGVGWAASYIIVTVRSLLCLMREGYAPPLGRRGPSATTRVH